MDLKELLKEAMEEGNKELKEEKINEFKRNVKAHIAKISHNNEIIEKLQNENESIKKCIASLDFKEFNQITL